MSRRSKGDKASRALHHSNPVAKHARKFNKAMTFRDRTRYTRQSKHRGLEPFPMQIRVIADEWEKALVA